VVRVAIILTHTRVPPRQSPSILRLSCPIRQSPSFRSPSDRLPIPGPSSTWLTDIPIQPTSVRSDCACLVLPDQRAATLRVRACQVRPGRLLVPRLIESRRLRMSRHAFCRADCPLHDRPGRHRARLFLADYASPPAACPVDDPRQSTTWPVRPTCHVVTAPHLPCLAWPPRRCVSRVTPGSRATFHANPLLSHPTQHRSAPASADTPHHVGAPQAETGRSRPTLRTTPWLCGPCPGQCRRPTTARINPSQSTGLFMPIQADYRLRTPILLSPSQADKPDHPRPGRCRHPTSIQLASERHAMTPQSTPRRRRQIVSCRSLADLRSADRLAIPGRDAPARRLNSIRASANRQSRSLHSPSPPPNRLRKPPHANPTLRSEPVQTQGDSTIQA